MLCFSLSRGWRSKDFFKMLFQGQIISNLRTNYPQMSIYTSLTQSNTQERRCAEKLQCTDEKNIFKVCFNICDFRQCNEHIA